MVGKWTATALSRLVPSNSASAVLERIPGAVAGATTRYLSYSQRHGDPITRACADPTLGVVRERARLRSTVTGRGPELRAAL